MGCRVMQHVRLQVAACMLCVHAQDAKHIASLVYHPLPMLPNAPAAKASELKAAVSAGKMDAGMVMDDAVATFKQKASVLKKGASADAAAAVDKSVAAFEAKANALKGAVAAGKADAASALDAALSGLEQGAEDLKDTLATADVDEAVKGFTCERGWRVWDAG